MEAGLQISVPKLWKLKPRRINNQIIMDYVVKTFPSWMWDGINACRLYLQVLVFSDLTTLDGHWIPVSIYETRKKLRDSV